MKFDLKNMIELGGAVKQIKSTVLKTGSGKENSLYIIGRWNWWNWWNRWNAELLRARTYYFL